MLTSLRSPRAMRPMTHFSGASRTLFNFSWWSGGDKDKDVSKVEKHEQDHPMTSSSPSPSTKPSPSDPSTSSSSPDSPASSTRPPESPAETIAEREARAIQSLLDRDGGNAGFGYEDGAPEGGQRRSVKREMFRVI